MPSLKGLIFDLDGTLLDSAPDLRQALNQTLHDEGRQDLSLADVQQLIGDGMLPMVSRAFAKTGKPIPDSESYNLFQKFIAYYRNLKPDPEQLYPLVRESLEAFHKEGLKLGLCTNKQEAATLKLLDGLDLRKYFGFVAGGDTFQVHKPHPGHVAGVLKELNLSADECAMIGDSSNDVLSAQGAGVRCLVVTHGYGSDLSALGADALIEGFHQIRPTLRTLGFILAS
jgi:phosphoglycolate phosphatase